MKLSSTRNSPLILDLNESLSDSDSIKDILATTPRKKKLNNLNLSPSPKKRVFLSPKNRKIISGYFNYNDRIEKRIYLENINTKTKRNTELLSKLSSTFRTYRFLSDNKDPKIESNLFSIGAKRSTLLTKRMNVVKNMIQNFDNQFLINLDDNKFYKKNELQKIDEESLDLNNFNSSEFNESKNNSKKSIKRSSLFLTNISHSRKNSIFVKDFLKSKKGKKYIKEQEKIEKKIKEKKKLLELKNAFKYYELLYNYKYFLTKKDNRFISFSRRRKMKKALSSYYDDKKIKIFKSEEGCEKCRNNKNIN